MIVNDKDSGCESAHFRHLLLARFLATLLLLAGATLLRAAPPDPAGPVPLRALGPSASFLLEAEGEALSLASAQEVARDGGFSPVGRAEPDFGFRRGAIWLRVPLDSSSSDPVERILLLGTNFLPELDVWLEAGETRHLLVQRPDSRFESRPLPYHELAVPVTLPPGPSVLWIRYRSEGASVLPLALETPASFVAVGQRAGARHFTYYGVMALFAAGALVAFVILPRPLFLAYAAYALALLLFLMQRDGHAFQLLWPGWPRWNGFASLPLGVCVGIAAAQFARLYLETRSRAPAADLALRLLIGWGALLLSAATVVPHGLLKQLGLATTTFGALLFIALGLARVRSDGWRYGFYVAGWVAIVAASALVAGASILGLPLSRAATLDITRLASVFDAAMMALAIVVGVVALRRDRDRFLLERMAMVERNAALTGRLARVEERLALTEALAEQRGRTLASASHDLRQPILALKAVLAGEGRQTSGHPARTETAEQSLAYLEQLVEKGLAAALAPAGPGLPEPTELAAVVERVEAGLLLSAAAAAHAEEAAAAGVRLRVVPSRHPVAVDPLVALRILANFLGNAIRAAERQVVMGARLDGDRLRLEIHDDGPGLGALDVARLAAPGARGPGAEQRHPAGKGLGLAIVADLAAAGGLDWSLANRGTRGAVARLLLPRALS